MDDWQPLLCRLLCAIFLQELLSTMVLQQVPCQRKMHWKDVARSVFSWVFNEVFAFVKSHLQVCHKAWQEIAFQAEIHGVFVLTHLLCKIL